MKVLFILLLSSITLQAQLPWQLSVTMQAIKKPVITITASTIPTPISYYKLEQNGYDATELNHLTTNGVPKFDAAGLIDYGYTNNAGTAHYFYRAGDNSNLLLTNGDFTLTAWFKYGTLAQSNNNSYLVSKGSINATNVEYVLLWSSAISGVKMQVGNKAANGLTASLPAITTVPGTWILIAGGWDSAQGKVWVSTNGGTRVYSSIGTRTVDPDWNTNLFRIGSSGSAYAYGIMDEIGVWATNLTDAVLQDIYTNTKQYPF